jgi:hypothetical protein
MSPTTCCGHNRPAAEPEPDKKVDKKGDKKGKKEPERDPEAVETDVAAEPPKLPETQYVRKGFGVIGIAKLHQSMLSFSKAKAPAGGSSTDPA